MPQGLTKIAFALALAAPLAVLACHRAPPEPLAQADAGGAPTASSSVTSSSAPAPDAGPAVPPTPDPRCAAPEMRDIYVLTDASDLYRFAPTPHTFTKVGHIKCGVSLKEASFGIDRDGIAWMQGTDGNLEKVDIRTLSCKAQKYTHKEGLFDHVTSAFATTGLGATTETLYVSDDHGWGAGSTQGSIGLGRVDRESGALTMDGVFKDNDFIGIPCTLAGTGMGKLYGVFANGKVAEINTSIHTAYDKHFTLPEQALPPTAFWGGALWLFRSGSVNVLALAASAVQSSVAVTQPGPIVSAGSSTCAPLVPVVPGR